MTPRSIPGAIARSIPQMTARTRIILLTAIFIALLGTYIAGSLSIARTRRPAGSPEPVVARQDLSQTAEIRVARAGGQELQTVLRRNENDRWRVRIDGEFYPADSRRVEEFLGVLGELRGLRIAGSDQQYHREFDVTDNAARVVELTDRAGSKLEHLLVGDVAAGGGRLYLREAGEEEVLVVHDDLAAYLDRGEAYWSDLRPLPEDLDPDSIMRISVDGNLRVDEETRMADRYTVFRNSSDGESQWSVDTGSGNVDERLAGGRVDAYAARLARVEAGAFVTEPPEGVGLERPAVSIRFENESGREYVIQIGDRVGETRFYMRVRGPGVDTTEEGEPYLYTVSASRLEPLLRNRDELMPQDQ